MIKIVCLAVFVTVASASLRGVVAPVERCSVSGSGTPVQLRIQNCEGVPPCTVQPNTDTLFEVDFIPAANSALAYFRMYNPDNFGPIYYYVDSEIGALTGGQLYTVRQTIRISRALVGQTVLLALDIYDRRSNRIEICVRTTLSVA